MKSFILAAVIAIATAEHSKKGGFQDLKNKGGPKQMFKFVQWMAENNKSYTDADEFQTRAFNFMKREKFILEHNKRGNNYTVGHNSRSDWSDEEWKSILNYIATPEEERVVTQLEISNDATPINWVDQGLVNAVQDQGQCGSCWAFGSLQSVENRDAIASGTLQKFSEQQLVDCVTNCAGCNGGMEKYAYEHFEDHDTMLETSYPYMGVDGTCHEVDGTGVRTTGNVGVTTRSADQMKAALVTGTLSVAIEADQYPFQSYQSGIFDNTDCGGVLDHAVGLVGWGTESGSEYWIVRNSWGDSWGEAGYIKMQIVEGFNQGICGVQKDPNYPSGVN